MTRRIIGKSTKREVARKWLFKEKTMLTTADFNPVDHHPYGLLDGYEHAYEKEGVLALLLSAALTAGNLRAPYKTLFSHPELVRDGLLVSTEDGGYCLTTKAIDLLYYVVYAVE